LGIVIPAKEGIQNIISMIYIVDAGSSPAWHKNFRLSR